MPIVSLSCRLKVFPQFLPIRNQHKNQQKTQLPETHQANRYSIDILIFLQYY